MKMDHHCFWLGNCVGIQNTRYFLQYGMYVVCMDFVLIPSLISMLIALRGKEGDHTYPMIISLCISVYTLNTAAFMSIALAYIHVY